MSTSQPASIITYLAGSSWLNIGFIFYVYFSIKDIREDHHWDFPNPKFRKRSEFSKHVSRTLDDVL